MHPDMFSGVRAAGSDGAWHIIFGCILFTLVHRFEFYEHVCLIFYWGGGQQLKI